MLDPLSLVAAATASGNFKKPRCTPGAAAVLLMMRVQSALQGFQDQQVITP
ncbi:MAG: hypothetical protein IPK26_03985 [Planctomycetes bacterium]|nr:hypothetical protein [Planctomycetota bacterium]